MTVRLGDPVEISACSEPNKQHVNGRYHRYAKQLGRGAYKTVYWGWDTEDGVDVAWNCIDLDSLGSLDERRKIMVEVETLRSLSHAHILRIREHWENSATQQLVFITDILQGGSLREYIRQRKVNLGRVKSWCTQILDALQYLHRSGIIHRDLKCDNIFIDGPSGKVTIGDLGLSTKYANSNTKSTAAKGMSIVGTPEFMAPELYEERYDEKVDIYAFGMCVVEMISKQYPYEECSNQIQVIRKVTQQTPPLILRRLHRAVRAFIELCIERDPLKRPNATELLSHPFLEHRDQLMDRRAAADFVFDEDRVRVMYKKQQGQQMQQGQAQARKRNLSTVQEQKAQQNQLSQHSQLTAKHANIANISKSQSPCNPKQKAHTKKKNKKYVTGTAVSVDGDGKIDVKLKIHHDKESQKVKFQYDPQTEDIGSVVREMVETLELDQSREPEIVGAITSKLQVLEGNPSPRPSTPVVSSTIKHISSKSQQSQQIKHKTAQSQQSIASKLPHPALPQPIQTTRSVPPPLQPNAMERNREQGTYSEPASANDAHLSHPTVQEAGPYQTLPETLPTTKAQPGQGLSHSQQSTPVPMNDTHVLPRVFGAAHQSMVMPITAALMNGRAHQAQGVRKQPKQNQSAPVTPGHSPESEKHMGYRTAVAPKLSSVPNMVADTAVASNVADRSATANTSVSNVAAEGSSEHAAAAPKLVAESLLDQIMALPRETIKARILQFGGSFNEDDGGGILVTKLFQLLSANTSSAPAPQTQTQVQPQIQTQVQPTAAQAQTPAQTVSSTVSARPSDVTPIMQPLVPIQSGQPLQAMTVPVQKLTPAQSMQTSIPGSVGHSFNQDFEEPVLAQGMLVHPTLNIGMAQTVQTRSMNGTPPEEMTSPHPITHTYPHAQTHATLVPHHASTQKSQLKRAHQRQSSMESLQSVTSTQSLQSPRRPLSPFPGQSHAMERTRSSESDDLSATTVTSVPEVPAEREVSVEQLRVRQKELIKKKIASQREQLKQHSNSGLGRDSKMDDVAAELALVEKQIKALATGKSTAKLCNKDRQQQSRHKEPVQVTQRDKEPVPAPVHAPVHAPVQVPLQVVVPVMVETHMTQTQAQAVQAQQGGHSRNHSAHSQPASSNHSRSSSSSHSLTLSMGDLMIPLPHSSPLISSSAKDEFAAHLCSLPGKLDLPPLGTAAQEILARSERARDRVLREQQQLEDEYQQYYSDQTEMLLLKLSKHRGNAAKRQQETLSTQQKLSQKQDKQRLKFQNIVDDQLQILQLTQELNEDGPITTPVTASVPGHVSHTRTQSLQEFAQELTRETSDRVRAFEEKQRAELSAFRGDLEQLNRLRLEHRERQESHVHATHTTHVQGQGQIQPQSVSTSPSPTRAIVSPRHSRHHSRQNSQHSAHSHSSSERGVEHNQHRDHRAFAFRVKSSEEDLHEEPPAPPPNTCKASKTQPPHFHSNSVPPVNNEGKTEIVVPMSKFRVSESSVPTTKK